MDLRANIMIRQLVEVVTDYEKYNRLVFHVSQFPGTRIIIFAETKKGVDQLTRSLRGQGYPARGIHGDKTQQDRDETLLDFRNGVNTILVATGMFMYGYLLCSDVMSYLDIDIYAPWWLLLFCYISYVYYSVLYF